MHVNFISYISLIIQSAIKRLDSWYRKKW